MLEKSKPFWISVLGNPAETGSEKYFVTAACFFASIFLFILCLVHILMNLKLMPVFYAGGSALVILGLFFLVRFGDFLFIPKILLSILGLVLLDFTWYSKFLSNGPVLLFILIFGALVLWVWDGKWLFFLLSLYFINVLVLFLIEKTAPEHALSYQDPGRRTYDIYLSFLLYSSLLIFLLYIVKREFIRQTEQALKADRLKSAFLTNMSHEIRTPLNAIVGFSQLLNEDITNENKQQYTGTIQQSSFHLLRLIDDILDLSRIEAGQFEIKKKIFSLKELFIELQDTFSLIALRKSKGNIQIKFDIPDGDIMLNTDPSRLKQVLSNILDNALKFTSYGSIILSCKKDGNNLVFSISDTGTGIPEEDQAIIFERFARFDYQGMNPDGTGIGLSIAWKIIDTLKGKMWVNSIVGKGSTFFFSLPSSIITEQSKTNDHTNTRTKAYIPMTAKPILIVEDDLASILIIKEALKPLNVEAHHVNDGYDAIDFVKTFPNISLILMDLKLPKLDGYEATKIIKQRNPKISIIAQTAYAMNGDREKAIAAGCDDYITKPIDLQQLRDLVRKYL
jgi:signal transduction histidine kinase/CheY-like chemotaxis protein